jgi:hypothetical protein
MDLAFLSANLWTSLIVAAALLVPGGLMVFLLRPYIFPQSEDQTISVVLAVVLVPALSLVTMMLVGVLMNTAGLTLWRRDWSIALILVCATLLILIARHGELRELLALAPSFPLPHGRSTYLFAMLGVSALIAGYAVDVRGAETIGREQVVALWVLPAHQSGTIDVGIQNDLAPGVIGTLRVVWPGGARRSLIGPLRVPTGVTWHHKVSFPTSVRGRVHVTLTAVSGRSTLSRTVSISIGRHSSPTPAH